MPWRKPKVVAAVVVMAKAAIDVLVILFSRE